MTTGPPIVPPGPARGDTGLGFHEGLGGNRRLGNEFAIPGKTRGVPVEFPAATEIQSILDAKTGHC